MANELQKFDLIELKWISKAFNEILGPDYLVSTSSKTTVSHDKRIDVLLQADRIPFAVDGINSETLNITLEVFAPVSTESMRDKVLKDFNGITGHKDGTIETDDGKTYNYASFLEFNKPLGPPQVSMGGFYHLLNITGTMLVSNAETGAIISNHVFTKLTLTTPNGELSGFVPTLQVDTEMNFQSDVAPTGNNNRPDVIHEARACAVTLIAIMLNRNIDYQIIKYIHGINFNLNEIIKVERIYPSFTVKKSCRIISAGLTESAGAYISYKLGLQEVDDD